MVGSRGRPRSEEARRAILDTALRLCEREGYQQVTIKAIADGAGVGRQTVYRWWSDKSEILLDALIDLGARTSPDIDTDTGDPLRDVETVLAATFRVNRELAGPALVGLMADAQRDPGLSDRLQGMLIGPRRDVLRAILRRGVAAGVLAEHVPLALVVDFAFGTMWYRLLSHHAPIDDVLAAEITNAIGRMLDPASPVARPAGSG